MASFKPLLAAAMLAAALTGARAQGVADGSDTGIGADDTRALLALITAHLRSPDARVSGLRKAGAGTLCGSVDVRNRMGAYTGPRPFVAVPADGFFGRLPEGPEMRNPASVADYRAMERARALHAEHCVTP